jgi:4-hydroxy-3-polyprenylbenzoate decarboxylase
VREKDFDLNELPVMKCWPEDGGRFITLPLVITRSPETGKQNVGMYRLQVFDGKTTGMHWHRHHDGAGFYREAVRQGKPLEVAVALGGDPATIYAATAPLPPGLDELIFAGFLRDRRVDVVRCRTVDLMVPAEADIVLEGYVDPDEKRREGPFGDHTGYYSLADDYPVFHLTAITHRRQPIYPSTIVGRPPMEDCFMGKATERLFLPLLQLVLPEIVDMDLPLEGVFHNCVIVSIRKEYRGHAQKVMNAIWGMGQMMFSKMIVVVDEDVDVHDYSVVTWRTFNNVDPRRDILINEGPLDVLDHSSPTADFGSKIGVDATRKWPEEGHLREWPKDIEMSEDMSLLVERRWKEYGLG